MRLCGDLMREGKEEGAAYGTVNKGGCERAGAATEQRWEDGRMFCQTRGGAYALMVSA